MKAISSITQSRAGPIAPENGANFTLATAAPRSSQSRRTVDVSITVAGPIFKDTAWTPKPRAGLMVIKDGRGKETEDKGQRQKTERRIRGHEAVFREEEEPWSPAAVHLRSSSQLSADELLERFRRYRGNSLLPGTPSQLFLASAASGRAPCELERATPVFTRLRARAKQRIIICMPSWVAEDFAVHKLS